MGNDPTKAELQAQIVELSGEMASLQKEVERLRGNEKSHIGIIQSLKTDLMSLTKKNARMEGYITRINESDPEPTSPVHRAFGSATDSYEADYGVSTNLRGPEAKEWWNRG